MVAKLGALSAKGPAVRAPVDADTVIRGVLFLAVFLTVWISFHPFQSLAAPPPQLTEGGDRANQIGFSALFLALAAWTARNEPQRLTLLLRPALFAVLAWCAVSVIASWHPWLAARRLAFTLVVMGISGMALLLPKNLRHFSDLMAAVALIVLAACYLGLLFAPSLSIHQATDFVEPEHAGNWRGIFPHKNQAGASMVIFVFVGMFVAHVRGLALGGLIVVPAAIFLLFTQSKTAIAMLPLVLIVAHVVARSRRPAAAAALVVALLALINLLSVGSVYFEPVRNAIGSIMPDATFTGRTDIWNFALQYAARRSITGYGFSAFWGTEQVVYGLSASSKWANGATDAHNSYVNLALTVGMPGLVLVIIWIVILPLLDFHRVLQGASIRPLQMLFLRVCLFSVYASCFETSLLQDAGGVWVLTLTAIFGLRYLSTMRVIS